MDGPLSSPSRVPPCCPVTAMKGLLPCPVASMESLLSTLPCGDRARGGGPLHGVGTGDLPWRDRAGGMGTLHGGNGQRDRDPPLRGQGKGEMDCPWQQQDTEDREPSMEGKVQGDRKPLSWSPWHPFPAPQMGVLCPLPFLLHGWSPVSSALSPAWRVPELPVLLPPWRNPCSPFPGPLIGGVSSPPAHSPP